MNEERWRAELDRLANARLSPDAPQWVLDAITYARKRPHPIAWEKIAAVLNSNGYKTSPTTLRRRYAGD